MARMAVWGQTPDVQFSSYCPLVVTRAGVGEGWGRDIGRMAVGSQTPDVQFDYNLIVH